MAPHVELVRATPANHPIAHRATSTASALGALGLALSGLAAFALVLEMIPLVPMCVALAAIALGGVTTAAVSRSPQMVEPDEIASSQLRASYEDLIDAARELTATVTYEDELGRGTSLRLRAHQVVGAAGRLARKTNRAHQLLARRSAATIAADIRGLHARAEQTSDGATRHALEATAAVHEHELAAINTMVAARERVHARLDNAAATLRACTTATVSGALDDAAIALAGSSLDERLDDLGIELSATLEVAHTED